ncbi:hypothetical protein KKI23_02615, partial [Patescibacteria group bacterium]|nr:hypothetical protein [Patescibacteria group bacterium]
KDGPKGFHPIGFALPFIFAACAIYIATKINWISPLPAGILFLAMVANPHAISLKRSLEMGKTVSAIIFNDFFVLWISIGSGLILVGVGVISMEELEKALMVLEAVIAFHILFFLRYYWHEWKLWLTLLILDFTVWILAISKFCIYFTASNVKFGHGLDTFSLYVIGILGAWLWVVIHDLLKCEAYLKKEDEKTGPAA